jgi:DNA topoisomerase VI subunit B
MSDRRHATLNRTTLETSRLLDYFTEKELTAQIGHPKRDWPLCVLKELLDNAIDACEDAGVAPNITVKVDGDITVADNGPGIPPEVVAGITDYSVRVSSREHYVSPTRGAQGNALKTILAMPFVLSGEQGRVEIAARGVRHAITVWVDRIRQEPVIDHQQAKDPLVKNGTLVRLHWPDPPRSILTDAKPRFLQVAGDFAFVNPHLSLTVDWCGDRHCYEATDRNWKKWLPGRPTSPRWWTQENFARLIAGLLKHDADHGKQRTVRELVAEFDGLSGSGKQKVILEATGLSRQSLSALRNGDGLDAEKIAKLLAAMKAQSKPVKPIALGLIGKDHLAARFEAVGAKMETFRYKKRLLVTDEIPQVVEYAFAWTPDADKRRLVTGVNWSPGITNPFRELGKVGQSLDSVLMQQRAGAGEPVVFLLHVACPRVSFTDRGKSAVVMGEARDEPEDDDL